MIRSARIASWIAVVSAGAALLTSCGKLEPPKDRVGAAFAASIPSQFRIVKSEVDYSATGDKTGVAKVKLTVAPKQDLYVRSDADSRAMEFSDSAQEQQREQQAIIDEANNTGVQIPPDERRASNEAVDRWNAAVALANSRPWIKVQTKAGAEATVYGQVNAAFEFKEWRFSDASLEQSLDTQGRPRSAFPPDAITLPSKEADDLVASIKHAFEAEKAANDALKKTVAEQIALQRSGFEQSARLAESATQTGIIYEGVITGNKWVSGEISAEVSLRFMQNAGTNDQVEAVLSSRKYPGLEIVLSGSIRQPDRSEKYPIKLFSSESSKRPTVRVDDIGKQPFFFNSCQLKLNADTPNQLTGVASVGGGWGEYNVRLRKK